MNVPAQAPFPRRKQIILLIGLFAFSRVLAAWAGLQLKYDALFKYWQYLDVETLRHHLLLGIWYDHAQPPCFNLLLGVVVKMAGNYAPLVFAGLLKAISLANTLLLFSILTRLVRHPWIPFILSLVYLLSPALLILENELFYTTFISLLLLTSVFFLLRLTPAKDAAAPKIGWVNILGCCVPLAIVCLTRSMYHILWLAVIAGILLFYFRKNIFFKKLAIGFGFCLLLVGGWYVKNYIIFGQLSTSSWIGMNMARTIFHDHPVKDSTRIEAFEPFSDINTYRPFISSDIEKKYAGLDDRDLLQVWKNDSFMNENHIAYIEISRKYMQVSTAYVKAHPFNYLKNVIQSAVMFFAPATRYPYAEIEAEKIKYYDLLYSFNLSHFAKGPGQRRIALTVSAIPKLILYLAVFFLIGRRVFRQKQISAVDLFIIATIGFVFGVSTLIEHYENMRFRFEIEPLFFILLGQVIWVRLLRGDRGKQ